MASLYMGLVNRTALLARSWPEVKSATARSVLPHVSYSKSTWNVEEPLKDPTVAPKYWKHITEQDWHAAEKELMNFGDEYTTRRQKEGRYLKQWLDRQPKP